MTRAGGFAVRYDGGMRRLIRELDSYTIDEDDDVECMEVVPYAEPPTEVQGEPWGWTKGPPRPRGYREDGRYEPV